MQHCDQESMRALRKLWLEGGAILRAEFYGLEQLFLAWAERSLSTIRSDGGGMAYDHQPEGWREKAALLIPVEEESLQTITRQQLDRHSEAALAEAWRAGGPELWTEFDCDFLGFIRWATRSLFTLQPDGGGLACSDPTARAVERTRHWFCADQPADAWEVLAVLASGAISAPEFQSFIQSLDELPARLIESATPSSQEATP